MYPTEQTVKVTAKPSRIAVELVLVVFALVFLAASWKLLGNEGPVDLRWETTEAQEIIKRGRPTQVCPPIIDRTGKSLVTTVPDNNGKDSQRQYAYSACLGAILGGDYTRDGLVGQQRLAGLPERTPGFPWLSWQGWWVGDPPALVSTVDAELSEKLFALLVRTKSNGCILIGTPDGELIAVVQNPSMDIDRMSDADYKAQLDTLAQSTGVPPLSAPWNWSLAPGSTVKAFLAAVARQLRIPPPSVNCVGYTTRFGRPLHCHQAHGRIDTYTAALAHSCNAFFYELSRFPKLNGIVTVSFATACGMASPQLVGAKCAPASLSWATVETGTEARALSFIGQGIAVSPFGMMSAYATLLHGSPPTWRLVRKMDGKLIQYTKSEPVFDSAVVRATREDLAAVAKWGTAATSMRPVLRYQPRVKTGTAQTGSAKGADSWTVGGFTVGKQDYVFCCLVRGWKSPQPRAQVIARDTISIVAAHTQGR